MFVFSSSSFGKKPSLKKLSIYISLESDFYKPKLKNIYNQLLT